jgi:hypothetical protein
LREQVREGVAMMKLVRWIGICSPADVAAVFSQLNAFGYNKSDVNLSGIVTAMMLTPYSAIAESPLKFHNYAFA